MASDNDLSSVEFLIGPSLFEQTFGDEQDTEDDGEDDEKDASSSVSASGHGSPCHGVERGRCGREEDHLHHGHWHGAHGVI